MFCGVSSSSFNENSVFLSFYWNYKELISYKVSSRVFIKIFVSFFPVLCTATGSFKPVVENLLGIVITSVLVG
jgi:hypothetical protein